MSEARDEIWFAQNLIAVRCGVVGNCSACIFRNASKFCAKMSCTYFDNQSDYIESVYWCSVKTHANIAAWSELVNWFNMTPTLRIMDISNEIIRNAVLEKTR